MNKEQFWKSITKCWSHFFFGERERTEWLMICILLLPYILYYHVCACSPLLSPPPSSIVLVQWETVNEVIKASEEQVCRGKAVEEAGGGQELAFRSRSGAWRQLALTKWRARRRWVLPSGFFRLPCLGWKLCSVTLPGICKQKYSKVGRIFSDHASHLRTMCTQGTNMLHHHRPREG